MEDQSLDLQAGASAAGAGLAAPAALAGEAPISTLAFDTVTNDADQNVDALMNNWLGGNTSGYWAGSTLTFSFTDSAADYGYAPGGVSFAGAFNDVQKAVTRAVLDAYASVSNISFSEQAAGSANATFKFAEGNGISTAFAYYPSAGEEGGDAWFNTADYNAPVLGTYEYHTFIHEIGHALGLKHGHETDGPGAIASAYDSMEYSVMTYRSFAGQDLTGLEFYVNETNSYAQSLMMLDIAAIQRFYGADFTTNAVNSTYTFSTATGEMFINGIGQGTPGGNKVFRTVWDGNGVDTYDLSNYTTNLRIDLTPGGYSDFAVGSNVQRAQLNYGIGADGSGGYVYGAQYEQYADGHLYNALQYNNDTRSLIENAVGGSGNDFLLGNAAVNSLTGGSGADTLDGGSGADVMTGGAGDDVYYVDSSLDQIVEGAGAGSGNDVVFSSASIILAGNIEQVTLTGTGLIDVLGNDSANTLTGNNQRNGITGGAGNDTIIAGGGDDAIDGGTGADSMVGGDGVDTYYVDNIGDRVVETQLGVFDTVWSSLTNTTLGANVEIYIAITGAGSINGVGNDSTTLMLGNEGSNNLSSLGGNDIILGREGNDTIDGGAGALDIISGGGGADSMTGGAGHDYFNYELISQGGDVITDFHTHAGAEDDILDFRPMFATFTGIAGITTVNQAVVSGHLTYVQQGADTQVFADADGGGNGNVLVATLLSTLAADVQQYTLI